MNIYSLDSLDIRNHLNSLSPCHLKLHAAFYDLVHIIKNMAIPVTELPILRLYSWIFKPFAYINVIYSHYQGT
jgi:hypothetical protein